MCGRDEDSLDKRVLITDGDGGGGGGYVHWDVVSMMVSVMELMPGVEGGGLRRRVGRICRRIWNCRIVGALRPKMSVQADSRAEGLAGFGDRVGELNVNFGALGDIAAQVREGVHGFQLSAIQIDARCILGGTGWGMVQDHRFRGVDEQSEFLAGGESYTLGIPSAIKKTIIP
ncbi:unnamed protein product [Schistocephalus solidus]|uniref:Uncharacterized protein n=1 Tax=Schistocephalus solidus TaxID=70667 RepID=A0A183SV97_SCHSO|nr:unnamed protein product [Schistocephalus solidus]